MHKSPGRWGCERAKGLHQPPLGVCEARFQLCLPHTMHLFTDATMSDVEMGDVEEEKEEEEEEEGEEDVIASIQQGTRVFLRRM